MNDHDHNNTLIQKAQDILTQETARLPESDLQAYVAHYFKKGREFIENIRLTSSPVYIFEKDVVGEKTSLFRKAFEAFLPDTGYYYAVKSNNSPELAAAVLETGFGLDVSSGVELFMALELGATDVVFSGPGKNDAELELAVMNNDKVTVLMDSFGELARLGKISETMKRTVRAGVRLTTEPKGLWRKFGILTEDLGRFIKACADYPYIDFKGLQFHSSWNMGPERQIAFIEHLGQCLKSLPEQDRSKITFIDIGGGYWPECGEWIQPAATEKGMLEKALGTDPVSAHDHYLNPSIPITVFAETLSHAIKQHIHSQIPCRICFEPGRWICHDAMHILLRVIDVKAPDLAVTDGGTNALGWERFESDYFPVLNLSCPSMTEKPCMILGSLCTPHDVWGYAYWGETIKEGDILMIPTQGAYTYSLRQQFIKDLPGVIVYPSMKRLREPNM